MSERTFTIIKPDAMRKGAQGEIIGTWLKEGFKIVALKMLKLSIDEAKGFYQVHAGKKFYDELCQFMASGPVIVAVLEADGAIAKNRKLMGATDSQKAEPGTLRARFGTNLQNNAVHGSDAPETAAFEIAYFFNALEMCG